MASHRVLACAFALLIAAPVACGQAEPTPSIRFDGNGALSDAQLLAETGAPPVDGDPRGWAERGSLMLSAAYFDAGYLQARVDGPRIEAHREGTPRWVVHIDENVRFRLATIEVVELDGAGVAGVPRIDDAALAPIRARAGSWFDRSALMRELGAIQTAYKDLGYADVEAPPELALDAARAEARVSIHIRPGPLVHIERIDVAGAPELSDAIRGDFELGPGDLFNETKLSRRLDKVRARPGLGRVDMSTSHAAPDRLVLTVEASVR